MHKRQPECGLSHFPRPSWSSAHSGFRCVILPAQLADEVELSDEAESARSLQSARAAPPPAERAQRFLTTMKCAFESVRTTMTIASMICLALPGQALAARGASPSSHRER